MRLINFHTHKPQFSSGAVHVVPYDVDTFNRTDPSQLSTVGIHPWSTESEHTLNSIDKLKSLSQEKNIIGIGEIGLDRLKGAPLPKQFDILKAQLQIALEIRKPVVIHCVRCWNELILILSDSKYKEVKKAIHGFRGKPEVAVQLVENGYYLSFGAPITHATPELAEALTRVPLNRLFFETDESEMPITEVYDAATDILDLTLEELVKVTHENFENFFGISPR